MTRRKGIGLGWWWAVLLLSGLPGWVAAAQIGARPGDSLASLLDQMKPGDELVLTAGTYKAGKNWINDKRGSKDAWYVVRGQEGAKVVIENEFHENTFTLKNCSFWKFQNLEITGKIGGDAFKWTGTCSDMVVENCNMHDIDGCGINCSSIEKMDRLYVGHCQIANTGGMGEGMYLGHDGGPQAVCDSVFEYNLIHDMGGTKSGQGDGLEINQGGNGNIVRYNVIFNCVSPCITIENTRGKANLVEGNLCWGSKLDANIQVNGCGIVKNNTAMGGKHGYSLGDGVQEGGNVEFTAAQIAADTLLQRGLEMLKLDPIVHGTMGRAGGKGVSGSNAALIAHLKGGTDGEKPADSKEKAETPAPVAPKAPQFDADAIEKLRQDCIARIVALSGVRSGVSLSVLIGADAQQVTILASDAKGGLTVKPSYSQKVSLGWGTLGTPMLGETLLALGEGGGEGADGALPADRLLAALCYYLADRPVQVAEQLDKINAVDADVGKQYTVRVAQLKP